MDIYSMNNKVVKSKEQNLLYDLFETNIIHRLDGNLSTFEVQEWHEMRIDLIFRDMYELESFDFDYYSTNIDVILSINDIDNPLNIKKGMILVFPTNRESLEDYRYNDDPINKLKRSSVPLLAVPNVSTKKDKDREKLKKGEFSLPPVANAVPKPPVVLQDGKIKIGGL